jgi:hypothetical protein
MIVSFKLHLLLTTEEKEKTRGIIAYITYFKDFLKEQPVKVQETKFMIFEAIQTL